MGKEYPELRLAPELAFDLGVDAGDIQLVTAGNKSSLFIIETAEGEMEDLVGISQDISLALGLPFGSAVNIRRDQDSLRLGPLVGILAESYNRQKASFGSQNTFFRGLLASMQELNGVGYVFTPQDINWRANKIYGYYLVSHKGSWRRMWFPFPDVCYNRLFKHDPQASAGNAMALLRMQNRVTTFNTSIGGKMAIHKQLARDQSVAAHLPATQLLSSAQNLINMLARYKVVYVKPVNGSQGQGITRVSKRNGRYMVRTSSNSKETEYLSITDVIRHIRTFTPSRQLMIQQGISVKGNPHFDFRVLVQKNRLNQWTVTGIAARVGSRSSITTNLHTGGHAETAEEVLASRGFSREQAALIKVDMEELAIQIAQVLSRKRLLVGELGLDFIVDSHGKVWFLEANPKPARQSFTQISAEIRRLAVSRPMEYACYLSGF